MSNNKDEVLFVGTAEAEHVEMYLKAIWHIKERNEPVKISVIAKMLNVRQPSVVQMLKKLNEKELVEYNKAGISGDMLLCSLVNIGANKSKIIDGIRSAESLCKDVKVKKIDFVEVKKNSLQATELLLEIDDGVHERKGIEIKEIIAEQL